MATHTPALPFSSIALGIDKLLGPACTAAVSAALALGYRRIDTAQAYGNEAAAGEAIRRSAVPRGDVLVTAKISRNEPTIAAAYDSARTSLRMLGVGYVDLFLVHGPGEDAGARRATYLALQKLREDGLVRNVGVSNYGVKELEEMEGYSSRVRPAVNQIEVRSFL